MELWLQRLTLLLELARLAQIINNDEWYDYIARIMQVFNRQQDSSNIPDMWPLVVNHRTQDFDPGDNFTLAALADSLHESLPKMYALLGGSSICAKVLRKP